MSNQPCNNLAEITSNMGIDTAILDTTKNRNSYYIYTKKIKPENKYDNRWLEG